MKMKAYPEQLLFFTLGGLLQIHIAYKSTDSISINKIKVLSVAYIS